jgi:hypothetical protein
MPIAPQRSYQLAIDVLEGFLLPESEKGVIQLQMGPYFFKTKVT